MQLQAFNSYFVYGLYFRDNLIYVGHTNNVTRRIQKHKTHKKFDEYKILHKTKNLRLSLYYERKLIRTIQPPLNHNYNPSFNLETALLYLKKPSKPKPKTKIKYNQKIISKKEFGIFTRIDNHAWELTKSEIKEDDKYLKKILNVVKENSSLTTQLVSQKIRKEFGERLPSDTHKLDLWVYFALKIFREEKRNIENYNMKIEREKIEDEKLEKEKIEEDLETERQNERNKQSLDPLDVDKLKITKPLIQSEKININ